MSVGQDVKALAALSLGHSSKTIHSWAARLLVDRGAAPGVLIDVGCGAAGLYRQLPELAVQYIGCDAVQYPGFPEDSAARFVGVDLNRPPDLPAGSASIVASIETVEHLENPRAFFRELARLARPGGIVLVTTPNQLSLLSKLTLLTRNEFNAFQKGPGLYPAHVTALLEVDLMRIAREVGLLEIAVHYSNEGRVPGTRWHWPPGLGGRAFSDHVALVARVG